MDYAALAKQYGAIDSQPAQQSIGNWMNGLSPKDQAEIKMKLYEEGQKRLAGLDAEISKAQPTLSDLEQFGKLNRETATGGFWDNVLPGTPMLHGEDINKMQAIQSRLGPAQRPTGSGASSDTDVRLYMGGIPSVKQPGNVNLGIRQDFQRKLDYAIAKRNAMQNYLTKNGHLNGFDAYWVNATKQPPAQSKTPQPGPVKFLGFE